MAIQRENVIRAAEKYVARGKLEAAIKEYRKVLAENPNDANTLNRVGDLYARIERFDEAVKLFSQIAEQYTRDGFFVKAIAIYKKIIKLDPTSLTVYERLAELYHKQGLLNEARTQYQVLADYYQKHDNAASAITIYQRMAELEPDNPSFHLKLAELYESQRLIDKAMKEYRLLADLLIVGGSVEEAIQVYLKALEVSSTDLEFVREAVSGLHDTGHVGGAAKVLTRAVELNPEATNLAREVGMASEEEAAAAEPEARPDTSSFEIADPDGSFEGEAAAGEAFDIPETSFDDIQQALEESGITKAEPEVGDEIFTFDLDDDEIPASLVTPPADMLEPGGAAGGAAVEPTETEDFDIDLDFDITTGEVEAPAPVGAAAIEEFEVDWPSEDMSELEVPAAAEEAAEPDFDLDDTVPGQRAEPTLAEPLELEAFELGEPSLEPVEHVGFGTGEAAGEVDIQLEALELEPSVFDSPAEAIDEAPHDDADVQAQFDQRREEDLLAEAKVFFKYGLQEKARDRLSELFQVRPHHFEGLELQTRIDLDAGQHNEVMSNANMVSRIAGETGEAGEVEIWKVLRTDLTKAGFTIEGDRAISEPGAKAPEDDRIAQLLDDLSLDAYDTPVLPQSDEIPLPGSWDSEAEAPAAAGEDEPPSTEPTAAEAPAVEVPAAEVPAAEVPAVEVPAVEVPAVEVPAVEVQAAEAQAAQGPGGDGAGSRKLVSLVDELGLEGLEDQLDDELSAAPEEVVQPTPVVEAPPGDPLDETGMSWLDDLESEDQSTAGEEEKIFEEEDDFFDLAAELERELSEDQVPGEESLDPQEQSLEDIIEGFKQGVAENLSPEDYDTHFNLGIAYREMGLLDEAIGEFQLAVKDDRFIVDSSSLLGICFLEKGLPELAVRSFRKGLAAPTISDDATIGLLYDMGTAYVSLGDTDAAYKTFVEVYGLNSHYRDVSSKLQELQEVQAEEPELELRAALVGL